MRRVLSKHDRSDLQSGLSVSMKALIDLLDSIDLPASVVSSSGKLVHINDKLKKEIIGRYEGEQFNCSWVKESGNNCPDCAERVTVDGRCFLTNTGFLSLVFAIRIERVENSLIRVYCDQSTPDNPAIARSLCAIKHLFEDELSDGSWPFSTSLSLVSVNLKKLLDSLSNYPEFEKIQFHNKIPDEVAAIKASQIILFQVSRRLVQELSLFNPEGTITIGYKEKGRKDTGKLHSITFSINTPSLPMKGIRSALNASGLRIERFCKSLQKITGVTLAIPKLVHSKKELSYQFDSPSTMQRSPTPENLTHSIYKMLTPREAEITELILMGFDNESLAKRLKIKVTTAKQHLKKIYKKTGANSRVHLIFKLCDIL